MPAEELPREIHDQEDTTEEHSFDELAKGLANSNLSRRQALKVLLGALLGGSLLAMLPGTAKALVQQVANTGNALNEQGVVEQQGGGSGGGGGGGSGGGCPPERLCRPSNTCCPAGQICAPGGGVCCPPESVCTVGGVPQSCCAGIGTCVNGVCVRSVA